MSLYKYFTTDCDTVRKAYGRPSQRKQAIELNIMSEMVDMDGYRYRILSHNCSIFTCAYMYTDSNGVSKVRIHTPSTFYDVTIYNLTPEVITVFGEDGLPTDEHRMELTVNYKGGSLSIPYHELADEFKPLFDYYIRVWGYPVR